MPFQGRDIGGGDRLDRGTEGRQRGGGRIGAGCEPFADGATTGQCLAALRRPADRGVAESVELLVCGSRGIGREQPGCGGGVLAQQPVPHQGGEQCRRHGAGLGGQLVGVDGQQPGEIGDVVGGADQWQRHLGRMALEHGQGSGDQPDARCARHRKRAVTRDVPEAGLAELSAQEALDAGREPAAVRAP